jgi:hypothetical protein
VVSPTDPWASMASYDGSEPGNSVDWKQAYAFS